MITDCINQAAKHDLKSQVFFLQEKFCVKYNSCQNCPAYLDRVCSFNRIQESMGERY